MKRKNYDGLKDHFLSVLMLKFLKRKHNGLFKDFLLGHPDMQRPWDLYKEAEKEFKELIGKAKNEEGK